MDEKKRDEIRKFLIFDDTPREDGRYGNVIPMNLSTMLLALALLLLTAVWVVKHKKGSFGDEGVEKIEQVQPTN